MLSAGFGRHPLSGPVTASSPLPRPFYSDRQALSAFRPWHYCTPVTLDL